jgi:hypothetical protein
MGIDYDSDDNDPKLNGTNIWCRFEQHRGQPVRAIVKDLVTGEGSHRWPGAFELKQIPETWSDLKALHELGILVRDLHIGNYPTWEARRLQPGLDHVPPVSGRE